MQSAIRTFYGAPPLDELSPFVPQSLSFPVPSELYIQHQAEIVLLHIASSAIALVASLSRLLLLLLVDTSAAALSQGELSHAHARLPPRLCKHLQYYSYNLE